VARGVVAWVLLVLGSAVAWWLLAPQPPVVTDGTQRVSPGMPELAAAQDGFFVLVTGVAGVLVGVAVLRARGGPTGPRALGALLASALGAVCAAGLGGALGDLVAGPRRAPALPADVADRVAEGVVVAPSGLGLSADAALVVEPLLTALVVTGALLLAMLRAPSPPARAREVADPGADAQDGRDSAVGPDGAEAQEDGGRPSTA